MRIIVQKFGGTSLISPDLRQKVIEHITGAIKDGYSPIIVVSAMGRRGDPYATDSFLDFIYNITPLPPQREIDSIISCGEIVSAATLASQLHNSGVKAVSLTGWQAGIITDGVFGQAEIIRIRKDRILRLLTDSHVLVIAGFQGVSEDGEINTLGRGGSDTSAVALGAALGAEFVEIYSDVDTVMTADPRLVPDAKPISDIGYQEVLQMAREGAKVIHPRAVDIALQHNLPLLLKKTGEFGGGTLVSHKKTSDKKGFIQKQRVVNGITHIIGLAQVRLQDTQVQVGGLEEILRKLALAGISIDLINISPQEKMFTVPSADAERVSSIMTELGYLATIRQGFAKVSVVGVGMRGIPGVMARVVCALSKAGTEILQTADSHLSISCLIPEKDVAEAVKSLHMEFSLGA